MNAVSARVYCTYFDQGYLSRGIAMIESLRAVGDQGTVVVLAMDSVVADYFIAHPELHVDVVRLEEVEARYPQLLSVKVSRTAMEYLFTLTPWLMGYVMETESEASWVTYLDADMEFFSSTDVIYSELQGYSVGIVSHRFTRKQEWRNKYGKYNVAWVSFHRDVEGLRCLQWWADSCLDWCGDYADNGRFADQGYLDQFTSVTKSVCIVTNAGVDVAPWNLARHSISTDANGNLTSDQDALVFFHFHGLRRSGNRYHFKHFPYRARTTGLVRDRIYRPFCLHLEAIEHRADFPQRTSGLLQRKLGVLPLLKSGRTKVLNGIGVVRGDYVDV